MNIDANAHTDDGGPAPSPRRATTSDKTLSIMDLFTPHQPEWSIEEMAAHLRLSHRTVYRYVRSLLAVGLVFCGRPGRYLLGPGITHYDRQFRLADPLIQAAEPTIRRLAQQLPAPGALFIARIYRRHVMSMFEQQLGVEHFDNAYDRGRFMPLYRGAPPLAILASQPIRYLKSAFMQADIDNGRRMEEWRDFRRQLRSVRTRGFSLDAGDIDPQAVYVSVPLLRKDGAVAGSLNFGAPSKSATAIDTIVKWLQRAAHSIGDQLQSLTAADQAKM